MQRVGKLWWARRSVSWWYARGAPRDAAVQHCFQYFGSEHLVFELQETARLVVHFEGVLPGATPCVAYAPIDLDGQVGIVVDVPFEAYDLVRLVEHLARCLYAGCGGGLRHIYVVSVYLVT